MQIFITEYPAKKKTGVIPGPKNKEANKSMTHVVNS